MRFLSRLAAGLLLTAGCAHLPRPTVPDAPPRSTPYQRDGARFVLVHHPADAAVLPALRRALDAALVRTAVWGPPAAPVVVHVHPDHRRLEAALGVSGVPWMRAWARWDRVDLQSPASFGILQRSRRTLEELVTHELTHCVMYQRQGDRPGWEARDRDTPLWFREGMASWTAAQGHRRWPLRRVGAWMADTGEDPLTDGDRLARTRVKAVYGAAHHAFTRLVAVHGAAAVRDLLARMRGGASFDEAFLAATGEAPATFVADTRRALLAAAGATAPPSPTREAAGPADARRPGAAAGAPPR